MTTPTETHELAKLVMSCALQLFKKSKDELCATADIPDEFKKSKDELCATDDIPDERRPPRCLSWSYRQVERPDGLPVTFLTVELNLVAQCPDTADEDLVHTLTGILGQERFSLDPLKAVLPKSPKEPG